ncbi:DUF4365 domain-containing protein [Streptomyces pactum]|uniref:DUF4365 domain-containing protein n=1 Tax=Streptomyces pactum TaxID=68249 RepID=A0ABS0NLP1_9ACTN|nr:DUF4365 domain-containing protein [Streptomyces pactum]
MTVVAPAHLVDRAGVSRAAYLVTTQLGWLFREQETSDIGIDAQIEVVDEADYPAGAPRRGTGRLLAVQIKSGTSRFTKSSELGWWFYCDASHIEYWKNHSLPVALMLFEPESEQIYWQHVNEETIVAAGNSYKVFVSSRNRLSGACRDELGIPARRQTDGGLVITKPTRGSSVRQADYELAGAIDLLVASMGKTLEEATPRDFRFAFAAQLRALYRRAGAPKVDVLSVKTGYEVAKLTAYLEGATHPSRGRVVAIVEALVECAHEKGIKIPGYLMDVRAWERMWRVSDRPGMQKIVKNKARKGASPS